MLNDVTLSAVHHLFYILPHGGLSSNDCVNSLATLNKSHWTKLWYPGIRSAVILWIIPRWGLFIIFFILLTRMEVTFPSEHLSVIYYKCTCIAYCMCLLPLLAVWHCLHCVWSDNKNASCWESKRVFIFHEHFEHIMWIIYVILLRG